MAGVSALLPREREATAGAWDCGTSGGREAGAPGRLEHDTQPGRVPSRKQGNAHHLHDLRLPLVLQAAFQVLGSALLLLLDTQGKGIGSGSQPRRPWSPRQ